MFFNSVKEINRLRKKKIIQKSNVFNSVKEINRLRKEINRFLSKGMPDIWLKVTIKTFSKIQFSWFENFVTR